MKKKYTSALLLGSLLSIPLGMEAQIRIVNSTTNSAAASSSAFIDASSNLSLNSTTNTGKGLLFPRTDLTQFTSFGGTSIGTSSNYPTYYDGLIVYNTATSGVAGVGSTDGTLSSGYWYYDNKSGTETGGTWKLLTTPPSAPYTGSTSVALNGSSFERAALTGDVTASANSNTTTIANGAVTSAKILDGTIATADIANSAITTVKIAGSTTNGQVLTTNASGVTSWAAVPSSADNLGNHTATTDLNMNAKNITNAFSVSTTVNAGSGGSAHWSLKNSSNSTRWGIGTAAVEGTGNAGEDFSIWSYSNTGGFLGNPLSIQRSTGNVIIDKQLQIKGGTPGAGKVLTSDANGLASWTAPVDTNTTYTVSNGLSLSGTNIKLGGTLTEAATINVAGKIITLDNNVATSGTALRINAGAGSVGYSQGSSGAFEIDAPNVVGGRFIIKDNGNIGIAVSSPTANLDIGGQIKIRGGAPGLGKVLTSDADGVASWVAVPSSADNLGNHTATTDLNMNAKNIINAFSVSTTVNAGSGGSAHWSLKNSSNSTRWGIGTAAVEGTGNAGEDFSIWSYSNTGGFLGNPLSIQRSTGNVIIDKQLQIKGGTPGADKVLTSDANGLASWAAVPSSADNLGNHTATTDLYMSYKDIRDANVVTAKGASTYGYTALNPGGTVNTGYIAFHKANGTRLGYIGWDNTNMFYNAENGAIHVFSTTIQTSRVQGSSDKRFKKDIHKIYDATEKLNQLNGYTYVWRDKKEFPGQVLGEGKDMGVIAQEVETVFPDAVSTNKDGYKSVNYNALIPVLIEALKDSNKKISDLEMRLKKMESRNQN